MKIAAGILCWNQEANGRVDLFDACLKSIEANDPDHLIVMDNGSTDGTVERVAALEHGVTVPTIPGFPHGNTCGYGMNKLTATLAETDADLIVLSNDDIEWDPDAFDRLKNVWADCGEQMAIISGLLEPTFSLPNEIPWNKVLHVAEVAGEQVWIRRSAPGGAWTFRRSAVPDIFPVSTFPGVDDVPTCHKLAERKMAVAAIDAARHAGIEHSTWNNGSHQMYVVETLDQMREQWL